MRYKFSIPAALFLRSLFNLSTIFRPASPADGMLFHRIKRYVPLEVAPLGVAVLVVAGFATYRFYKMSTSPEIVFRKPSADRDWETRNEKPEQNAPNKS